MARQSSDDSAHKTLLWTSKYSLIPFNFVKRLYLYIYMVACDKRSSTSSNISPSDLSVAVAFTWSKRAEVVAPWRSLNFYSGFMRFACQRGGEWWKGGRERGRRDLMMMYRGRATERRENGRGGLLLYFHQRKKRLNTRKEKEREEATVVERILLVWFSRCDILFAARAVSDCRYEMHIPWLSFSLPELFLKC